MFDVLRELNRKLDEVVGRQERTMSLLSAVQAGGALGQPAQPQGQAQMPPPVHGVEGITRQEVQAVLNNQNIIVNSVVELK